jgi:hypothetical protein
VTLWTPFAWRALIWMRYELSPVAMARRVGVESAAVGRHRPLLELVGSAGAVGPVAAVGMAAVAALVAVEVAMVGALGAAGDRPGAGAGLGGVTLAVQLHTTLAPRTA